MCIPRLLCEIIQHLRYLELSTPRGDAQVVEGELAVIQVGAGRYMSTFEVVRAYTGA